MEATTAARWSPTPLPAAALRILTWYGGGGSRENVVDG